MSEPIAITGIGCRFPGGADATDTYWNLLRTGIDAITEVPADRWDLASLYHPDPDAPGKMYARYGAFLPRVDEFDAQFFGISPREATQMDPQQRLLLEVAWEALESAGQPPSRLAGSQTGVFLGISTNDYAAMRESILAEIDPYTGTGSAFSVAAGRLSYLLGLHGPNVAIDTACSSSLVAAHLACQSLRAGECDLALVGGVSLILTPDTTVYLCRLRALAPDGRCKTFDAAADGYARGEGCGIVVLKRLSDALRDRDTVLAVIRGSAVNHDGRSNGLTAPNGAAQEAVIRAALQHAGVPPSGIGFVEAHGTGTPLGDEIELQALASVLGTRRSSQPPVIVGSVKTNFGHLEAASGVAALIKAVLAIQHGEIPPHLHFKSPNPRLSWKDLGLQVPAGVTSWPAGYAERIAGVSNFGISGTNAHIVLAEAPAVADELTVRPEPDASHGMPHADQTCLLPFSARHPDALRAMAEAYRTTLQQPATHTGLPDLCYTAAVRRSHYEHRLALLGSSEQELDARLAAFLHGESSPDMWTGVSSSAEPRKLAFVFPGQGGQWAGMGRQLLESEPVFRDAIERCDRAMRPFVEWSLLGALAQDEWERIDIIQPAVFAIQTALAALWGAWGIVPDAVVGHSMGEVAAAHVAGVLGLDDAARIICRRSALLRRLSGRGAMAIVELSLEEAHSRLAGYEQRLSVAVSNSSRSTVLSGDVAALDEIISALEHQGIFCRRVKVDVASHSPQMDVLREELLEALQGLQPQPAILPFYSTVTGMAADGRDFDAAYWVRNLRQPVLFAGAVERIAADGHDVFVELSPHPILLPALEDNLRGFSQPAAILPSLRRDEPERQNMLRSLGALYALGQPVAWDHVYAAGGRVVALPSYPWQRERFWTAAPGPRQPRRAPGVHPFLETHFEPVAQPGTHLWETALDIKAFPYLADHRLGTLPVFPAAAYAELALAAAKQAFGDQTFCVEDLTFKKLLIIDESAPSTIQSSLSEDTPGTAHLQVASRLPSGDTWTINATGTIRLGDAGGSPPQLSALDEIRSRCSDHLTGAEYYQGLAAQGLPYGPSFTGIAEIWRRPGEALARLELPSVVTAVPGAYQVHPALLDMCFQAMGAALAPALSPGEDSPYLPVSLGSLRLWQRPGHDLTVHACLTAEPVPGAATVEGDLWLRDGAGHLVLEVRQFRLERLAPQIDAGDALDPWLYDIVWRQQPRAASRPVDGAGAWVLLDDGSGVGARLDTLLKARGAECVLIRPAHSAEFPQVLQDAFEAGRMPCRGVVWLCRHAGMDDPAASAFEASARVLSLMQALTRMGLRETPRLVLVTGGCQSVGTETFPPVIAQAPLWGLGRTIAMEHPELNCTCIDLGGPNVYPGESGGRGGRTDSFTGSSDAELQGLCDELQAPDLEAQIALRGDERYVARLTRHTASDEPRTFSPPADQAFRLEIDRPGVLGHLTLRAVRRRMPDPGEVEIDVAAAGLNFLDVLAAMGVRPDQPEGPIQLGGECSGTVTAIGEGVRGLQVGERVIAIGPSCFATSVTTRADFVILKPESLSFADAATIPIAFLTAYYALHHVGRLQAGERVLIHSAAGGVGLAAVQVARWLGAEIFATAGNPEKRAFLRSLGISDVMDSRSLEFAREVQERTGNRGVDVVLNSLTGEALSRSLALLAPYGRFLEIGKKDVYENHRLGLWPFHKNLSYSMIDLARLLPERPALCSQLLREIAELFRAGTFRPLPQDVFPIAQTADAFHQMAQARHIGKVVLSLEDRAEVRIAAASAHDSPIHANATYLITGGLGGLGLSVASWMVGQGARHLVLVGRSGASAAASAMVDEMRAAGAEVRVIPADVSEAGDLGRVLAAIDVDMPRLSGVIHAAGVLEDSTLLQLDPARLSRVMAPKVTGAWNLHMATRDHRLDFFVLYSSGSALLGSPGQGNYNAANAFLDGLAHYRRRQGWPALSIDWGPFSEVGMVAGPEWTARLANRGMGSLTSAQGTAALRRLLGDRSPQIAVLPLNLRQWRQVYPRFAQIPFFAELVDAGDHQSTAGPIDNLLRQQLTAADANGRLALLEQHVREQVASVLRLQTERVGLRTPLHSLGMDSLMALELRNRLEDKLGVRLSATLVWQHPTVAALAEHMAGLLGLSAPGAAAETQSPSPEAPAVSALDRIAQMSDEEVERLFAEKIAQQGR